MCSMMAGSSFAYSAGETPVVIMRIASRYRSLAPCSTCATVAAGSLASRMSLTTAHCCACAMHARPSIRRTGACSSAGCLAATYGAHVGRILSATSRKQPAACMRCLLASTTPATSPRSAAFCAACTCADAIATTANTMSKAMNCSVQMPVRGRLSNTLVHTNGLGALGSAATAPGDTPFARVERCWLAAARTAFSRYSVAAPMTAGGSHGLRSNAATSAARRSPALARSDSVASGAAPRSSE
mmetsp:Transcript_19190/g.67728  ORF Transcript_19190/g.67728 Transcript_19190/m.67728 type:complete len:243 (+) Transcript_19190:911-1639(+)